MASQWVLYAFQSRGIRLGHEVLLLVAPRGRITSPIIFKNARLFSAIFIISMLVIAKVVSTSMKVVLRYEHYNILAASLAPTFALSGSS